MADSFVSSIRSDALISRAGNFQPFVKGNNEFGFASIQEKRQYARFANGAFQQAGFNNRVFVFEDGRLDIGILRSVEEDDSRRRSDQPVTSPHRSFSVNRSTSSDHPTPSAPTNRSTPTSADNNQPSPTGTDATSRPDKRKKKTIREKRDVQRKKKVVSNPNPTPSAPTNRSPTGTDATSRPDKRKKKALSNPNLTPPSAPTDRSTPTSSHNNPSSPTGTDATSRPDKRKKKALSNPNPTPPSAPTNRSTPISAHNNHSSPTGTDATSRPDKRKKKVVSNPNLTPPSAPTDRSTPTFSHNNPSSPTGTDATSRPDKRKKNLDTRREKRDAQRKKKAVLNPNSPPEKSPRNSPLRRGPFLPSGVPAESESDSDFHSESTSDLENRRSGKKQKKKRVVQKSPHPSPNPISNPSPNINSNPSTEKRLQSTRGSPLRRRPVLPSGVPAESDSDLDFHSESTSDLENRMLGKKQKKKRDDLKSPHPSPNPNSNPSPNRRVRRQPMTGEDRSSSPHMTFPEGPEQTMDLPFVRDSRKGKGVSTETEEPVMTGLEAESELKLKTYEGMHNILVFQGCLMYLLMKLPTKNVQVSTMLENAERYVSSLLKIRGLKFLKATDWVVVQLNNIFFPAELRVRDGLIRFELDPGKPKPCLLEQNLLRLSEVQEDEE